MRIDKVHIKSKFKNLDDFEIEFDSNAMETVLVGLNATGKSNFMEALIIIFRDLELKREPQFGKKKEALEYYIKYNCRNKNIEAEFSKGNGYVFKIDGERIKSKTTFFNKRAEYLPKHIFFYYSGISDRVKELYSEHEKKYYQEIIKTDAKPENFNEIRPIFLVQNIHASFALIAFYMFREREQETIDFLKDELRIHDFGSALFILKEPSWARQGNKVDSLWGAKGLVKSLMIDILGFSLAPIATYERVHTNYKKTEKQSRLYLFINSKEKFKELIKNKYDDDKVRLFNALESLHLSDLMQDVKINVLKENVDGELSMNEMSEGEKQLLTVLGLLKFTKDDESLILLDEPDTHLNPHWKWKYLDYLDKVVKRPENTQIIFCTHDPLLFGSMDKSQVRIFNYDSEQGKTVVREPAISPKEMSVEKILTSDLFGLPSIMNKELEDKLNEKRYLQAKMISNDISKEDRKRFEALKEYLDEIGFYDITADSRYNQFLKLTSKHKEFAYRSFSKEEKEKLDRIAKEVIDEIKKVIQMRYIDLERIKSKIKKIKFTDVSKKHLEPLLFNDPKTGEQYINWEDVEKKHLENIKSLSVSEKKEYISKNSDWNILQKIMMEEYGNKCWYSEAPIGNGELEIDHFRPKNRARQDDEKSIINKDNGYWWLAYNFKNFRLSGALANKRRRDRLKENSEVEGKGDIFPLDLDNGKIAEDECSTFCEKPLLLDPIIASDVGLLTFDEGGTIYANPLIKNDFDKKRVETSIILYHLNLDQLETARQQVWSECSGVIEDAFLYYTQSDSEEAIKLALKTCAETINRRINPKADYSSVAKACLNLYRKREGYCEIIELLNL
ncbi:AAA family ATPase [Adhaeribacter pallidiroseus]|uniref:Endonuclease GajA/Old nuclease/RecF-like AAA domain-containing protein n=1 Tax=Adhaeribacter pallidiroseus TaxID=2072847 RepID=A0A369QHL3_9BACT|nr:AAA family ATPase [Adhaeribacter pallidiroseus]RDC62369.1 hypothetical protein AHMF7616_00962 [Adhaeribacter pallidiroseus]